MILPDVNVLIYALRPELPQHQLCRGWLTDVVNGSAAFGISRLVLSSVVRVTTNHRAFEKPEPLTEAFGYCNWLASQPNAVLIEPGDRHWQIFQNLCLDTNTRGARVTDAWLAALAIESGSTWVTFDRDFARFPDLKWSVPGVA
jgi:uncharacterized protein